MTSDQLTAILLQRRLIRSASATITPLAGGVSSDIFLVEDGDTRFVLKLALPKLRVKDDWFADVNRNRHEQDYIDYVSAFLPGAVPRILHRAPEHGFFTMEYLGGEFKNWKTMLLACEHNVKHAEEAGRILGTIHARSWNDSVARDRFATDKNFYDLRIEPYLITTGKRNPPLQSLFEAEAKRLAETKLCLVHGDFSPKNILVSPSRMVILDCEVAWFGDPVFDIAFLLNHLVLKMLLARANDGAILQCALKAWETYSRTLPSGNRIGLDERVSRLLLMLMLARVDGKSPVEYLRPEQQQIVRTFVTQHLCNPRDFEIIDLLRNWQATIGLAMSRATKED